MGTGPARHAEGKPTAPPTRADTDLERLLIEANAALAERDAELDRYERERARLIEELHQMRQTRIWKLAGRWWEFRNSHGPRNS